MVMTMTLSLTKCHRELANTVATILPFLKHCKMKFVGLCVGHRIRGVAPQFWERTSESHTIHLSNVSLFLMFGLTNESCYCFFKCLVVLWQRSQSNRIRLNLVLTRPTRWVDDVSKFPSQCMCKSSLSFRTRVELVLFPALFSLSCLRSEEFWQLKVRIIKLSVFHEEFPAVSLNVCCIPWYRIRPSRP